METSSPHWATKYIGCPWKEGAHGPDVFDCWGLLWYIYLSERGIHLPQFSGVADMGTISIARTITDQVEMVGGDWSRVRRPKEFDGVAIGSNTRFCHVGVYVDQDGGLILHSTKASGVVAQSLHSFRVKGYKHIAFFEYTGWRGI